MNEENRDPFMRDEYDFTRGVRGKHHEAYEKGTNVVLLDPDVAAVFTDSATVNRVLRTIMQLARDLGDNTPKD